MNVSYAAFLRNGVEGQYRLDRRSSKPQDTGITKYAKLTSFQGKITKNLQSEGVKTIHIDDAYKFSTVSDKIRNECSDVWTKLQKGTKNISRVSFIGGIVGFGLTIGFGALSVSVPAFIPVAITVGIVSLAALGLAYLAHKRSKEAGEELAQWADPTNGNIEACRKDFESQKAEQSRLNQVEEQNKKEFELKIKEILDEIEKENQSDGEEFNKKSQESISRMKKEISELNEKIEQLKKDEDKKKELEQAVKQKKNVRP